MLYSQVLYGFSMPPVKAIVVFMLLHFTKQRKYPRVLMLLYVMQSAVTVMAVIGILASRLYCKPIQAYWNPLLGECGGTPRY
jgi:pilus assembly protein TadC